MNDDLYLLTDLRPDGFGVEVVRAKPIWNQANTVIATVRFYFLVGMGTHEVDADTLSTVESVITVGTPTGPVTLRPITLADYEEVDRRYPDLDLPVVGSVEEAKHELHGVLEVGML